MAEEYDVSKEEILIKLKRQFDGYHFSRRMRGVYNPFSILRAFKEMLIDDYWFQTGSPSYLVRLLAHSDEISTNWWENIILPRISTTIRQP